MEAGLKIKLMEKFSREVYGTHSVGRYLYYILPLKFFFINIVGIRNLGWNLF